MGIILQTRGNDYVCSPGFLDGRDRDETAEMESRIKHQYCIECPGNVGAWERTPPTKWGRRYIYVCVFHFNCVSSMYIVVRV